MKYYVRDIRNIIILFMKSYIKIASLIFISLLCYIKTFKKIFYFNKYFILFSYISNAIFVNSQFNFNDIHFLNFYYNKIIDIKKKNYFLASRRALRFSALFNCSLGFRLCFLAKR